MTEAELSRLPAGDPLYGVPTALELLEAVRGFLDDEVRAVTEGRTRYLAMVAANVLAMVERQLLAEGLARPDHDRRLAEVGSIDEADLARAIRSGELDDRPEQLRALLTATVAARLAVSNPRYPTS